MQTNLDDLVVYLKTGKSPKYDGEAILGRWDFNVSTSVAHAATGTAGHQGQRDAGDSPPYGFKVLRTPPSIARRRRPGNF